MFCIMFLIQSSAPSAASMTVKKSALQNKSGASLSQEGSESTSTVLESVGGQSLGSTLFSIGGEIKTGISDETI